MKLDFSSRLAILGDLLVHYHEVVESGSGRICLISGGHGSGRSRLLRVLATELLRQHLALRILVHDRRSDTSHVESWPAKVSPVLKQGGSGLTAAGRAVKGFGAEGATAGSALRAAGAAAKGIGQAIDFLEAKSAPEVAAPEQFVAAARRYSRPSVCIVDDIDVSDLDLWWYSIQGLCRDIRDRPVLVIATFADTARVGADGGTSSEQWATRLCGQDARWLRLEPLTVAELASYISPAEAEISAVLHTISSGNLRTAVSAWSAWRRDGAVVQSSNGDWRISGNRRALLDSIGDSLRRDLRNCHPGDLQLVSDVYRWLEVGILEGPVFTAAVVADVLRIESDTVIDGLDAIIETGGAESPILEIDSIPVGSGALWRYKLKNPLHFDYLRVRGLMDESQQSVALRYALSLETAYGPQSFHAAEALAHLYRIAHNRDKAQYWQGAHDRRMSVVATLVCCQILLSSNSDSWSPADFAHAAKTLNSALGVLEGRVEQATMVDLAERAWKFAVKSGDGVAAAHLVVAYGVTLNNAGRQQEALEMLEKGYALAKKYSIPQSIATAASNLTMLISDHARAAELAREAAEIAEEAGDARAPDYLASYSRFISDPHARLAMQRRALNQVISGDVQQATRIRVAISQTYLSIGDVDDAVSMAEEAVTIARGFGNLLLLEFCLLSLTAANCAAGNIDSAIQFVTEAFDVAGQVSDPVLLHHARFSLYEVAAHRNLLDVQMLLIMIDLDDRPDSPFNASGYMLLETIAREYGADDAEMSTLWEQATALRGSDGGRSLIGRLTEAD